MPAGTPAHPVCGAALRRCALAESGPGAICGAVCPRGREPADAAERPRLRGHVRTAPRRGADGRLRPGRAHPHPAGRRGDLRGSGPPRLRRRQPPDRRLHAGFEPSAPRGQERRRHAAARGRLGQLLPARRARRRLQRRHRRLGPVDRLQLRDGRHLLLRVRRQQPVDLRRREQPAARRAAGPRRPGVRRRLHARRRHPVRPLPPGGPVHPQPLDQVGAAAREPAPAGGPRPARPESALLRRRRAGLGHADDPHRGQRLRRLPPDGHGDPGGVHRRLLGPERAHAAARSGVAGRGPRGAPAMLGRRPGEHARLRLGDSACRRMQRRRGRAGVSARVGRASIAASRARRTARASAG